MSGRVKYIGGSPAYDLFYKDKSMRVKPGIYNELPLDVCKRLIETGEFKADEDTHRELYLNNETVDIADVSKLYEKCFIIGSGESLNGFDYTLLDDHYTIALNFMYRKYPDAKAVFFMDKDVSIRGKDLLKYNGHIFCAMRTGHNVIDNRANVIPFYFKIGGLSENLSDGLYGKSLSGVSSLNLALVLGFKKIYLLGYDGPSANPKRVDGYDGKNNQYDEDWWKRRLLPLEMFKKHSDKIFNCNMDSTIDLFDKVPIKEAIK